MSSVVVSGDTSGAITLSAPAVAGTTTLTLPAVSGGVLNDANCGVCRAWVNFNGTGTVAIRASFNVSSITDNAVGDYTVNMTNALSDSSYGVEMSTTGGNATTNQLRIMQVLGEDATGASTKTTSTLRIVRGQSNVAGAFVDGAEINVAIFR